MMCIILYLWVFDIEIMDCSSCVVLFCLMKVGKDLLKW